MGDSASDAHGLARHASSTEGSPAAGGPRKSIAAPANLNAVRAAMEQLVSCPSDPVPVKALASLAGNGSGNRAAIAEMGGIESVVGILQRQVVDGTLSDASYIEAAIDMLNHFSQKKTFREQVAEAGGISTLIKLMLKFIGKKSTVEKSLVCLGNLGFSSDANVKDIIGNGGAEATLKVMQQWAQDTAVLQFALILLVNCMYGIDENKRKVGQVCAKEIAQIVARHYKDANTFNAAIKAMGNLSYLDSNIYLLMEAHAIKYMVQGMDEHVRDAATLQVAIDVIGNFASANGGNGAESGAVQQSYGGSARDVIVLEGGAARIVKALKESSKELSVIMSALDALANLAVDVSITDKMMQIGIVETLFEIMAKYERDEPLMTLGMRLMANLALSKQANRDIVAKDGIEHILASMEIHAMAKEFLVWATVALKNIAQESDFRLEIEKLGGIEVVLDVFERHIDHRPLTLECLQLLIRMTAVQGASEAMSTQGMRSFLNLIREQAQDDELVSRCLRLLGLLTFHDANIKVLVQYGGVSVVIDSISVHQDNPDLLLDAVQTLGNVTGASTDFAKLVADQGGANAILAVQEAYSDANEELLQFCKTALIPIVALNLKSNGGGAQRGMSLGADDFGDGEDPLKQHRNILVGGSILTEWTAPGVQGLRHLFVDFENGTFVRREVKSDGGSASSGILRRISVTNRRSSAARVTTIPLRDIRLVRIGIGEGNNKFGKQSKSELCFSIVCRAETVDFEAPTLDEAKQWTDAWAALLLCIKKTPQWIR